MAGGESEQCERKLETQSCGRSRNPDCKLLVSGFRLIGKGCYLNVTWGPSINYVRNCTCYLDHSLPFCL